LQVAWAAEVRKYIESGDDLDKDNAGFDPRKVLKGSNEAMKNVVREKLEIFGSAGKGIKYE
jgi:fructose-bisphosphate aldolase class II